MAENLLQIKTKILKAFRSNRICKGNENLEALINKKVSHSVMLHDSCMCARGGLRALTRTFSGAKWKVIPNVTEKSLANFEKMHHSGGPVATVPNFYSIIRHWCMYYFTMWHTCMVADVAIHKIYTKISIHSVRK